MVGTEDHSQFRAWGLVGLDWTVATLVSTQAEPVVAILKFQPREFPLLGSLGKSDSLGLMDSWPNTVLQVSLRELFCVTHLDVTFWLKWAEKMLSFCQRLIGYPLEQTAPKELFVQTNYFMCSY